MKRFVESFVRRENGQPQLLCNSSSLSRASDIDLFALLRASHEVLNAQSETNCSETHLGG